MTETNMPGSAAIRPQKPPAFAAGHSDGLPAVPPVAIRSAISIQVVVALAIVLLAATVALGIFIPAFIRDAALNSLTRASADQLRLVASTQPDRGGTTTGWIGEKANRIRFSVPGDLTPALAEDPFLLAARQAIGHDAGATVTRVETHDGIRYLRVAIADPREQSAGGLMEMSRDIERDLVGAERLTVRLITVRGLVAAVVVGALIWLSIQTRRRSRDHAALLDHVTQLAFTDGMTGLLNRARFMEMGHELRRKAEGVFVLVIDVDHFKEINDEHGHAAGDSVIREVASRLSKIANRDHLLARLGGDEFILAGPMPAGSNYALELGEAVAESLGRPVTHDGVHLNISASIGCASSTDGEDTLDQLIIDADKALYHAKRSGKNRASLFTDHHHAGRPDRRTLERALRQAIDSGNLECHFQPLVDGQTGHLTAFEALARLKNPDQHPFAPHDFFALAEEFKLGAPIGDWVIGEAVSAAAAWPETIGLNLNLNGSQLLMPDRDGHSIAERLGLLTRAAGLDPHRVTLEITEDTLESDNEMIARQLTALKALGMRIALANFGTGPSSLSHLWTYPIDALKIDRSLAEGVDAEGKALTIITSINALGQLLGLKTVAQGIETEIQARFFRNQGFETLQGFHIGRPVPAGELAGFILRHQLREARPAGVPEVQALAS